METLQGGSTFAGILGRGGGPGDGEVAILRYAAIIDAAGVHPST